jgi:hypothetical protein
MTLTEFRQLITTCCDVEDLRTFCFDLNIDYESLRGEGKVAKVRELVHYAVRANRLPDLVAKLVETRPHIAWQEVLTSNQMAAPIHVLRSPILWLVGGGILLLAGVIFVLVMMSGTGVMTLWFSQSDSLTTPSPTLIPTGIATARASLAETVERISPTTPVVSPMPIPTQTKLAVVAYQVIRLDSVGNSSLDLLSPPSGDVILSGVPFYISSSIFKSQASPIPHNDSPTIVQLPINLSGAFRLHILLNTGNGFNPFYGRPVGRVVVHCGGGSLILAELTMGIHIREWHRADNVVSMASQTQQVWAGAIADSPHLNGHIDMLTLDLPEDCHNNRFTLLEILDTSVDTVGSLDPALNLIGVTVEYHQ